MATSTTNNYAHPYISIQIYDNTEFVEETITEERKDFNGMQVGFFAGGRDNQLLYMQSQLKYLRECGRPNFRKLGQAAYNVDSALATGNCGMYILNLRPENATYANTVIMVRFKISEETNSADVVPDEAGAAEGEITGLNETTKKLVYSFYSKSIERASTEADLLTKTTELMETTPDEEGFYNMPLMLLYSLGRGEYGNNIHMTFGLATEYNDPNEVYEVTRPKYHIYSLTVMEPSSDGLNRREVNYGNFDDEGFDPEFMYGPSTFMGDVINDIENGSQRIKTEIFTSTINAMCKLYNDTFNPEEKLTASSFDILTGLTLDGVQDVNVKIDDTAEDFLNLFSIDGFALKNGIDGWVKKQPGGSFVDMTDEEIVAAKDELLIKAFDGEIDPFINSRFSSPCNFNLDAGYSVSVKRHMADLANRRKYDCMTYLDLQNVTTTSGMISMLTSLKNIYGFNIIKEGHCYKWRDREYTGKICDMTITHWLSKALPNHIAENSLTVPMAKDTAILKSGEDYIPGSFKPVIDPDNNDVKNIIYRMRCNCYETLTYNSFQRSTAITTCQTKSDRLLEMNEYILQRGVKIAYDILASKVYKLGEASDRTLYEEDATDIVSAELDKFVRSASVTLEMTSADEKKSLLRIKLRLVFKTIVQNGEVEVYLDPRVNDTISKVSVVTDTPDFDE